MLSAAMTEGAASAVSLACTILTLLSHFLLLLYCSECPFGACPILLIIYIPSSFLEHSCCI
jgi:hypothetical protein